MAYAVTKEVIEETEKNPLAILSEQLSVEMAEVNLEITESLHSSVPLIPKLAGHLIQAGGKRIRPLLTVAANKLVGGNFEDAKSLAAAVEFIHSATLLHDDVVDNSGLRRGQETANEVWGNKTSVLVGDFLFAKSFQLMVKPKSTSVLEILANASSRIAEGEVLQLTHSHDLAIDVDTCLTIIGAKTAELFAAACEVGALIAIEKDLKADSSWPKALRDYGYNLGLIFQIVDDILDYTADAQGLGKAVGDDFAEGKITLPVILCYKKCSDDEREFWKQTLVDRNQKEDSLHKAIKLIQKHNGFEEAQALAHKLGEEAKSALGSLPESPIRDHLADMIDYCLARRS